MTYVKRMPWDTLMSVPTGRPRKVPSRNEH